MSRLSAREASEVSVRFDLVADFSRKQVDLLQVHKGAITLSEYWTEPQELQLHQALLEARERLARRRLLLRGFLND